MARPLRDAAIEGTALIQSACACRGSERRSGDLPYVIKMGRRARISD
jgi:hypothetical protein